VHRHSPALGTHLERGPRTTPPRDDSAHHRVWRPFLLGRLPGALAGAPERQRGPATAITKIIARVVTADLEYYTIRLRRPFATTPTVTATVAGRAWRLLDNAHVIRATPQEIDICTGDDRGNRGDRDFHFQIIEQPGRGSV
jgi:hypothetical protein